MSVGLWVGVAVAGSLGAGARFVIGGVVDGVAGDREDGLRNDAADRAGSRSGSWSGAGRWSRGRGAGARWQGVGLGTPLVDVTGSLLLGILTGLVLFHGVPRAWEVVLGTGFCGGYTTFGTACVETVRLAQHGRSTVAAVHALAILILSTLAGGVGLALAAL